MKRLFTTLGLSLYVLSAAARSLSLFKDGQHVLDDDRKLPVDGENPFEYCDDSAKESDFITIERINITPNPPEKAHNLTIEAVGVVKQEIVNGAYAEVKVLLGRIRLLHKIFDLCELVGDVDLKCPIQKGETTVKKTVELPAEIPPVSSCMRLTASLSLLG